MKIKLDENVTIELAPALSTLGHDVHTAFEEGLSGKSDSEVWSATQREQRFLITQDFDFSDIRRFTLGAHCGILLLRLASPNKTAIVARVSDLFRSEDCSLWSGCLVVATDSKVRVVRP
jgi:predicted nuclease of predicted toxin-antitoxin system